MTRTQRILAVFATFALLASAAPGAYADRRYFTYSYTPWRAPAGSLELETWLTARANQSGVEHTAWDQRVEFEYSASDRLTLAAYLNYSQPGDGESGMRFSGPSLEAIVQLADRGRIFGDPAAYLEVGDNGEETEIEAKLLLGRRFGRWLTTTNLIGEFEFHREDEGLEEGRVADDDEEAEEGKELKAGITLGIAYELSPRVALGLEARYQGDHPDFKARDAGLIALGPVLNVQTSKVQLAVTVMPQVWGTPGTEGGHRNLVNFEKTQVRAILGIDL